MKPDERDTSQWPAHYEITVSDRLDPQWSTWFDGLSVIENTDGNTSIRGLVADQSALYGLLARARDLGLTLLAVRRI